MSSRRPPGALEAGDPMYIGPFQAVGRLGASGIGVTYLARDRDGRPVAVKVIRPGLIGLPALQQRFLWETQATGRVRSPALAAVVAADASAHPAWLAYEYIDGPSLQEVVDDQVPDRAAAISLLGAAVEALMAIHQAGVVHGDLKPSNILWPPTGGRVIDVGIGAARASLVVAGQIDTPRWLAPEQVLGYPATPAADVFAWGGVALYALTGRVPFGDPGDAPALVAHNIVNSPVDLAGVPPDLAQAVSSALAKDPAQRPTMPVLLEMLLPGRAPPPGPWPAPAPVPNRRRTTNQVLAGVAATVLAIALVAFLLVVAAHRTRSVVSAAPAFVTPVLPANPEQVPIPSGPQLGPVMSDRYPQTIDGISCGSIEQLAYHVHARVTIFVNGQPRQIPYGIGITPPLNLFTGNGTFVNGGTCFYWLHTHAADGVIHIESPTQATYDLGQFFDIWGQTLGAGQVGPATGALTVFVDGAPYTGDPRLIPLVRHTQIQLDVGAPAPPPTLITFPPGL